MPTELHQLLENTVFLMPNFKWISLALLVFAGFILRPILQVLIKRVRKNSTLAKENQSFWGHVARLELDNSLAWVLYSLLCFFVLDNLKIHEGWDKYLTGALKLIFAFHCIRLCYIIVDAVGLVLVSMAAKTETTLDDQLAPFATKTLKVLVIILGTLSTLKNFGVEVMSVLAGLGLGGLALALAAQDTAANLFGSITILMDTPFKIGDLVRIAEVEGLVEEVGFRSTRIRTLTNALVIIPNSVVAKEKVENLGERKLRRIRQVLGLHYETTPEKVQQFCEEIRYLLKNETLVNAENFVVNFINYNASTLDVLVVFHLKTNDTIVELETAQKIFLEIWKVAKKLQVEFAYPTQSVYLPKM